MAKLANIFILLGIFIGSEPAAAQTQAERVQYLNETKAKFAAARDRCLAEWQAPQLDPIRNLVAVEASPYHPTPVQLMIIDKRPNSREKAALLVWAAIRERCFNYGNEAVAAIVFPPNTDEAWAAQVRSGLAAFFLHGYKSFNYLTSMLYSGKLTFGEFNRQRAQFNDQIFAELRQWLVAMDARSRAEDAQKAAAVQQATEAAVMALKLTACVATRGHIASLCQ